MATKVKIIELCLWHVPPHKWETSGEVLKITPTGRHTVSFIRPDNGLKITQVFTSDGKPYPHNYGISKYRMIKEDKF
jgi:hypothetical protein